DPGSPSAEGPSRRKAAAIAASCGGKRAARRLVSKTRLAWLGGAGDAAQNYADGERGGEGGDAHEKRGSAPSAENYAGGAGREGEGDLSLMPWERRAISILERNSRARLFFRRAPRLRLGDLR